MLRTVKRVLAAGGFLLVSISAAAAQYYTINGQVPPPQVQAQLAQMGLPSGHYWLTADGYWGVMGNTTPLGNIYGATEYVTPNGGGHYGGSNGSWGHYIDRSITPGNDGGFGVGSTGDGCIYTTSGWSNC